MSDDPQGGRSSELRLALAMRGGVSLAVWMGGACCETAALRAAAPAAAPDPEAAPDQGTPEHGDPDRGQGHGRGQGQSHGHGTGQDHGPGQGQGQRQGHGSGEGEGRAQSQSQSQGQGQGGAEGPGPGVYRGLLQACGYDHVNIDVLVGTSAGGLNGVLMACHLVYGMPFGKGVRDLWLRLGDLEGLLRRSLPFRLPASLLRGDEVFYRELRAALGTLVDQAPPDWKPPASLRLILTATRLRPRRDWVRPTLGRPLLVGRSNAYFRFRHRSALTDFPDDTTGAARETALNRLAYAARTTSSFPGAFEPGRVYVGNGAQPFTDPLPVDMRGVSSETGHPDESLGGCAELMDGGLLDNIPVAWAVRAVAAAPVDRPAERWLLLFQPVPPFPPPPERGTGRRVPRLVRTAAASLAVKAGTESLRDDALEMEAAAAAARQRQCAAGVLPPALDELQGTALARLPAYRAKVGAAEAARLIRLLEDPAEVTGPDGLPLPAGPGPLEPLDATGPGSVTLFGRLRAPRTAAGLVLPEGSGALPEPGHSPLALARTVRLLMDWVRAWEACGTPADPALAADLRRRLYAFRFAVATVIAARDRLLLAAYRDELALGLVPSDAAAPYRAATRRLGTLMPVLPPPGADAAQWDTWAVNLAQAVTGGPPPPAPAPVVLRAAPAPLADVYAGLWERLAELAGGIGAALPAGVDGYEALEEAVGTGFPTMADALAFAEVLLGPLRPGPLDEGTDIRFHAVSAANTSWATATVLPGVDRNSPKDLVKAKLSGNQLNNFAAFLSARWRMSDWTWGRLDGAASLVSVVATDARLKDAFGGIGDPAALGESVAEATGLGSAFIEAWAADVVAAPDLPPWDRVRGVLTQLRQREILDEELPLIADLHRTGPRSGNRPPEPPPAPPPLEPGAFDGALDAFREIGAEGVGRLLRARDPRRSALRAGLIAWPALQPTGRAGARLVQGVLGALKPLVCLPLLCAVLAPWHTLAAAALMWTGIAFSTGRWSSLLGHVPVCLYAMAALAAAARQLIRPAWPGRITALVLAAGPPLALWLLRGLHPPDVGAGWRTVIVGATFALAAGVLLDVGSDRWEQLLPAAAAAGVVAGLIQFGRGPLGGWWGALILYAVLFWVTFVLPWLYPRLPHPQGDEAGPSP
ncbi:DUF3376 domain-containing protein [Streptomyces sp. NPDC090445]|uniref:DUF3376 domain-containing protein n=1 Tax=Streptomyces sp. NPDC090445 TaxID=3365963 RepID=UPI00382DBAE0